MRIGEERKLPGKPTELATMFLNLAGAGSSRMPHHHYLLVLEYLIETHRAHSHIKRGRICPSVTSSSISNSSDTNTITWNRDSDARIRLRRGMNRPGISRGLGTSRLALRQVGPILLGQGLKSNRCIRRTQFARVMRFCFRRLLPQAATAVSATLRLFSKTASSARRR